MVKDLYESESFCDSVVSYSLQPHGPQPIRLLCPCSSPGKNTGVGRHSLLQGIFLTQGWNLGLPHRRQILYRLSHQYCLCSFVKYQLTIFTEVYFWALLSVLLIYVSIICENHTVLITIA